jgi:hypothetical protein
MRDYLVQTGRAAPDLVAWVIVEVRRVGKGREPT